VSIRNAILPAVAVAALTLGTRKVYTTVATKERAQAYMPAIAAATKKYGLPEGLLYKVLEIESSFRPDIISGEKRSPTGAVGIAQFLPSTAAWLLKTDQASAIEYVKDPIKAIDLSGRYLQMLRNDKRITSWEEAAAAYNQGAGGVNIAKRKATAAGGSWQDFLKPEGRNYVSVIKKGMGGAIA
jgi:soluble lytic murein transglycosylase-like protein